MTPQAVTPRRNETAAGMLPQSISFPSSSRVVLPPPGPSTSSAKAVKTGKHSGKPRRMENMSVEHLLYLERRLQQLLEVMPARSGQHLFTYNIKGSL